MPRKRHMAKIMRKSCRERKKVIWSQVALMLRGYPAYDATQGKHLLTIWVKGRCWKASHLFKQLKCVFLGLAETLSKAQPFLGT